jgi:release factor glutamine methyltransferase
MSPLRTAVRSATDRLAAAGVDSPEHDARALAVHVLGLDRPSDLLLVDDLRPEQATAYDELVARRADRVPLQHLTGSVGFRHIVLEVGPGVFVPRPETESVVQWAVDAARAEGWTAPLCVDLCTGSGTIAFALANELPGATVHAVERDPDALAWTRRNAANRVAAGDPEVSLHLGSAEDALPELDGQLDLVISNPPYVATTEAHIPDPEVVDHDPGIALWAGEDGLDVVRLVERAARRLLKPGGLLVVEHSDRQGRTAPALLEQAGGWVEVADHRDQAGRDRYVTARWVGAS